ncbi:hypothetical protein VTH06DRAFT_8518 [Thermothelomyces fergusii]
MFSKTIHLATFLLSNSFSSLQQCLGEAQLARGQRLSHQVDCTYINTICPVISFVCLRREGRIIKTMMPNTADTPGGSGLDIDWIDPGF